MMLPDGTGMGLACSASPEELRSCLSRECLSRELQELVQQHHFLIFHEVEDDVFANRKQDHLATSFDVLPNPAFHLHRDGGGVSSLALVCSDDARNAHGRKNGTIVTPLRGVEKCLRENNILSLQPALQEAASQSLRISDCMAEAYQKIDRVFRQREWERWDDLDFILYALKTVMCCREVLSNQKEYREVSSCIGAFLSTLHSALAAWMYTVDWLKPGKLALIDNVKSLHAPGLPTNNGAHPESFLSRMHYYWNWYEIT